MVKYYVMAAVATPSIQVSKYLEIDRSTVKYCLPYFTIQFGLLIFIYFDFHLFKKNI